MESHNPFMFQTTNKYTYMALSEKKGTVLQNPMVYIIILIIVPFFLTDIVNDTWHHPVVHPSGYGPEQHADTCHEKKGVYRSCLLQLGTSQSQWWCGYITYIYVYIHTY